jgi:hypothetical protein
MPKSFGSVSKSLGWQAGKFAGLFIRLLVKNTIALFIAEMKRCR